VKVDGGLGRQRLTLASAAYQGLFVALAVALAGSTSVAAMIGFEEGLVCFGATAASMAASLPLILRREVELFEPIWLVVLTVMVGVTTKAFYLFLGPQEQVDFLLVNIGTGELLTATCVIDVGLILFVIGYLSGSLRLDFIQRRRQAATAADRWSPGRLAIVVGVLLGIGVISWVLFLQRLDPTLASWTDLSGKRFVEVEGATISRGALGYLRWGILCIELAFYLVFVQWVASRRSVRSRLGMVVAALAVFATVFPIFASERRGLAFLVVRCIIIWMCIRGLPRVRSVVVLVAVTVLTMSVVYGLRSKPAGHGMASTLNLENIARTTIGGRDALGLAKTAVLLEAVPREIEYQHGRTLLTWLVAPVPRSMWPEKPAIGVGIELGEAIYGTAGAGVPPGIVGELHLNFGYIGVFIGLLMTGLIIRFLSVNLIALFPSKGAILIYAVLITHLTLGLLSTHASGVMVKLLQEIVPLGAAILLLRPRARCRGRTDSSAPKPGAEVNRVREKRSTCLGGFTQRVDRLGRPGTSSASVSTSGAALNRPPFCNTRCWAGCRDIMSEA